MAKPLLTDELWERIEPILPSEPPKPKGGRPRVSDRQALTGILFVLRSGCPWEYLPKEMNCGSGMTCWRRLKAWHKARVWDRMHQELLSKLRGAGKLDFSRAVADSSSIRAIGAGKKVDRTQPIAVVPVRSTTSLRMRKVFRSRWL